MSKMSAFTPYAQSPHKRDEEFSLSSKRLCIPDDLAQAVLEATNHSVPSSRTYSHTTPSAQQANIGSITTLCVQNLPEWVTEYELRDLFARSSTATLEYMMKTGSNSDGSQIIKNVHIVTDHDTGKCVGYAYVECVDHSTAAEMLAAVSVPNFFLPGSNRLLTVSWATSSPNLSSVLSNYDFYIGNLRPGLTEKSVFSTLKSLHPAISSVRLVPQELLGLAPPYTGDPRLTNATNDKPLHSHRDISCAFYLTEATGKRVDHANQQDTCTQNTAALHGTLEGQHWSCGFIRLHDAYLTQWRSVLDTLSTSLAGEVGECLRRDTCPAYTATQIKPTRDPSQPDTQILPSRNNQSARSGANLRGALTRNVFHQGAAHNIANVPVETQKTLFVGNLREDEKEEALAMLFSPFGTIISLRVANIKRIAFIEMSHHISALAAICHLSGCMYQGQKLQVCWGRSTLASRCNANATTETFVTKEHSAIVQEKSYAAQILQAMQPQAQMTRSLSPVSSPSDDPDKQRLYLASFYASLSDLDTVHTDLDYETMKGAVLFV